MQRKYFYEPKGYKFRIIFIGYVMIVLAVALAVMFVMNPTQYLYLFGVAAAAYGALNTFVFKSNPREVVIDDESVAFVSFGEVKYEIKKLKTFNVREFANAQFYIRVEDKSGRHGRYWVHYYYFEDREEMINDLYWIEKQVNPASLKFRGRENMFNVRPCYEKPAGGEELPIDPFFEK